MKILQIINSHALQDGGAQRLALELHRGYLARGHDAHLLSLMRSPTGETATYSLNFESPYRPRVARDLRRFLAHKRWNDVDVVHVHLFPAQIWAPLCWPKRRPARLITTEHNTFNRRRAARLGRALDAATLRQYRRIICISPATSDALSQWQPQTKERLVTIPNGIDLTRYSRASRAKKTEKPVVIAVGRIAEQKNYGTAIRAVAALSPMAPSHRDFELWIVGQDELNGEMQRLCAELNQAERIRFLGFQADVPALLQGADVFLLTSKWEGFGLAVAEAMAAGLPVIASDVPGVREVVGIDGSCGRLINPHSPADVAEKLEELLQNPSLRQRLSEAARLRARQFDIEKTIENHLALYAEVS